MDGELLYNSSSGRYESSATKNMPPIEGLTLEEKDMVNHGYEEYAGRTMVEFYIPRGTGTCIDRGCFLRRLYVEILERFQKGDFFHPRDLRCRVPGRNYIFRFWPTSMDVEKYHAEAADFLKKCIDLHGNELALLPWSPGKYEFIVDSIEEDEY